MLKAKATGEEIDRLQTIQSSREPAVSPTAACAGSAPLCYSASALVAATAARRRAISSVGSCRAAALFCCADTVGCSRRGGNARGMSPATRRRFGVSRGRTVRVACEPVVTCTEGMAGDACTRGPSLRSAAITRSSSNRTLRPARTQGIRPWAAQRYTLQRVTPSTAASSSTSTKRGGAGGALCTTTTWSPSDARTSRAMSGSAVGSAAVAMRSSAGPWPGGPAVDGSSMGTSSVGAPWSPLCRISPRRHPWSR